MSLSGKDRVVKQWNGIKETNTATGSDKEWPKKKKKKKKKKWTIAETTGASLLYRLNKMNLQILHMVEDIHCVKTFIY